jgi:hypothetical protein
VIRRSTFQKNCQKRVNTRENASRRHSVSRYPEARAHPQSIVLSKSFPCCSFSLSEVSQTCSQLIHMRFMAALASGLETRNQLRKRQEKNEFYFRLRQKKFLDWEKEARVFGVKTRNSVSKKFRASQSHGFGIAATKRLRRWSAHPELTELACARNFPVLRAEGKRSASSRCRQPIPISAGVFRCALSLRTSR